MAGPPPAPQQICMALYGQAIQLLRVGSESPGVPNTNQPFVSLRHSAITDPAARRSTRMGSRRPAPRVFAEGREPLLAQVVVEGLPVRLTARLRGHVSSLLVSIREARPTP